MIHSILQNGAKDQGLITHLPNDLHKIDEPRAKALFQASVEVLGLQKVWRYSEDKFELFAAKRACPSACPF